MDDTDQKGQGSLIGGGREAVEGAVNDQDTREEAIDQVQQRYAEAPGLGQAADALRGGGPGDAGDFSEAIGTGQYGQSGAASADYAQGPGDAAGYGEDGG